MSSREIQCPKCRKTFAAPPGLAVLIDAYENDSDPLIVGDANLPESLDCPNCGHAIPMKQLLIGRHNPALRFNRADYFGCLVFLVIAAAIFVYWKFKGQFW